MSSSGQSQQTSTGIDAGLMLDVRSLRARVEFDEGVPSLTITDGISTVQICTGLGGPSVRDLIPVGRMVASALRFQTACNRFVRSQQRPEPLGIDGPAERAGSGDGSSTLPSSQADGR